MVKELLKPIKRALEKQEKKRKKLVDKHKKPKVRYDKVRDVYVIKMKSAIGLDHISYQCNLVKVNLLI